MRLRKKKSIKNKPVTARYSEVEYNKMKIKAGLYTEGNVSEWIVFASLNHRPDKKDFE